MTNEGLELIKRYEGFRAKPYLCPAGVPTIGYGVTVYPDGTKVTLQDPPITQAKAPAIMPCSGRIPMAIAKPIAIGMAVMATIKPALKSL